MREIRSFSAAQLCGCSGGTTMPRIGNALIRLRSPFSKTSDRFNGFGTGFGNEYYRTAFVAKRLAHLAGEVFSVLVGKKVGAIEEQQKGGRRLPHLSGVEELNPMSMRTDRLAPFDSILQGSIQDGCGNFLLQLGGHVAHGFEQTIQIEPGLCRSENHRRIIKEK